MAEAVGITGSVIAIVEISVKIANVCTEYTQAARNAPKDIARLKSEVERLAGVFAQAKELLDGPHGERLRASQALCETVNNYQPRLEDIRKILEPRKPSNGKRIMRSMGFRVLKWPFDSAVVEKIIEEMVKSREIVSLALSIDQMSIVLGADQKIDLSMLPIADGAAFDFLINENEPVCHPDTRLELLRDIREWVDDPDGKSLFWLNGMAGTGKSTISRSIARDFSDKRQLGASFFFKSGERDRANASKLFPTIAAQLVTKLPILAPFVSQAIANDPHIPRKTLQEQFDKLILQPLSKIKTPTKLIFVIDALDECDFTHIGTILHLFAKMNLSAPLDLRIFLTSRPELPIRLGFAEMSTGKYRDLILHEIAPSIIERDISIFLQDRLEEIKKQHNRLCPSDLDLQLPPDWPSKEDTRLLVQMAIPLFIFAATMCRFIGSLKSDPADQLVTVLKYRNRTSLEKTYLPILEKYLAPEDGDLDEEILAKDFRLIVGTIVLLEDPLSSVSLSRLLKVKRRILNRRLQPLHSVLNIPSDKDSPVRMFHLSFRDFLVDSKKNHKSPFWINHSEAHSIIATNCLDLLSEPGCLRQDICQLISPGALRSDIEAHVLDKFLPPEIRYACRYWAEHLERSGHRITDDDPVSYFLKEHFLHWLEVLGVIGKAAESVSLITRLQYTCRYWKL